MYWLATNKRNAISGVANTAVFKNESGVQSETNYTLIWEVDSYSPIIEYNLMFRRYFVRQCCIVMNAHIKHVHGTYSYLQVHENCYGFNQQIILQC
jgi:hypothetical protein